MDRQGVEIDYCPNCRGVWLDRGELDKIIERVSLERRSTQPSPDTFKHDAPPVPKPRKRRDEYEEDDDEYDPRYEDHRRRRKRGSFLENLFDFLD